jgi:hypothetical protein
VKTNDLINVLAQDAPVRWGFGRVFAAATIASVGIAGALFFALMGFRPDIAHAIGTVRFLFKFLLTVMLGAAATGAILRMARPGVRVGAWGWALAAVPVLLAGAVIAELLVMPEWTWAARMAGHNARFCLTLIPLLAIAPLACLLMALRSGAPGRPGLAGALAGLAAAGIAAAFYAANCTDDSPLFVAAWYPLAAAIVTGAGYLAGSRLLKW